MASKLEASKIFHSFSTNGGILSPSDFQRLCAHHGVSVSQRQCISAVRCLGTDSNKHLNLEDLQRWWRYGTLPERMARVALNSLELERLEVWPMTSFPSSMDQNLRSPAGAVRRI